MGAATGFLMMGAVIGLMATTGSLEVESEHGAPVNGGAIFGSVYILFCFLVQGGIEEVLARGWLLPTLARRMRLTAALAASTVAFALAHLATNSLSIVNLLLFGLFLAIMCLRDGDILGACARHGV